MDKSNTKQAQVSAELEITFPEVETILKALDKYHTTADIFTNTDERHNAIYLWQKFSKLYNELKGGKQ